MIFVDDFTRIMWVEFIKDKFEAFEKFEIFRIELRMNLVLR